MNGELAPSPAELAATVIFGLAVVHTFSTKYFEHLAHVQPRHAGVWHLLAEVEVVFGFWAMVLIGVIALLRGGDVAADYLEAQRFTEPVLIFVIMVIAASRPVLDFAGALMLHLARLLPLPAGLSYYVTVMSIGPLLGSMITEPAAMTLTAMLLRERYFSANAPSTFKYVTLGILLVNVSVGGTLTHFAAPPVLMVSERWGWDSAFMLQHFGWKATLAVLVNACAATYMFRQYLSELSTISPALARFDIPVFVIAVHLAFLAAVVITSHHLAVFVALFLFFLGFTEAYRRYQNRLILREGLLVGFFLAGLVVLGGMQQWWLQPLLSNMGDATLYYGTTALTAITDNAALTYLGSQVQDLPFDSRYALVAGAVTGGGLTVIANAPNPAGFSILKGTFSEGAINPLWLAAAALPPTCVTIAAFRWLPL